MARKRISAAARKKLSRAAKSRPRTKSGKFKKGGTSRRARRKKPARKKPAKPRRVKRRKVATPARSSGRRAMPKRNSRGQFVRSASSSSARRRRVRDNPAPAAFPLDLAVLNPSGPDLGQVAKLGAGVAAGMVAGSAALHFSGQSGKVLGDVIKAGTPIALGYGVARLGAPNIGHGMMAAGAAAAVVLTAARLLKLSPVTREYGHMLSGIGGDGATLFLQDEAGRIFVQGGDGQLFRLSGMNTAGSDPLVSVMLDDGSRASMEMLGRLETGESETVAVLRDPSSRELSVMQLSGIVRASDQFSDRALAGIVEASDQFSDRSISGIVRASDQFSDRSLSGVVRSEDQFLDGGAAWPAENDPEYY